MRADVQRMVPRERCPCRPAFRQRGCRALGERTQRGGCLAVQHAAAGDEQRPARRAQAAAALDLGHRRARARAKRTSRGSKKLAG
jgi:hypothetical protein